MPFVGACYALAVDLAGRGGIRLGGGAGRGQGAGGQTDGWTKIYVQISKTDECLARPVDAETVESRLWVGPGEG